VVHPIVKSRQPQVAELCKRFRVRRLELFGSATGEAFDPERSDLDFLVEFDEMPPAAWADAYFGLLEALEALFRRPVDLVTLASVRNPYFRAGIERTRRALYAS
jgi:hypothetical protein